MLDVDRRGFIAAVGATTAPGAFTQVGLHPVVQRTACLNLESSIRISEATARALVGRACRLVGEESGLLVSSEDEGRFALVGAGRKGSWVARGGRGAEGLLRQAAAFACPRALDRIGRGGSSFRWFSGCSFGGATAHLFRGPRSAVFLVTPARTPAADVKRLDVVFA